MQDAAPVAMETTELLDELQSQESTAARARTWLPPGTLQLPDQSSPRRPGRGAESRENSAFDGDWGRRKTSLTALGAITALEEPSPVHSI